jgi:tRNA/tmRNA/rRNA uracil-C5-methylase (TrmA/RlmC/RlmD family)
MALGKELENSILPTCIELYGGVGTIGLHLSDIVSSLVSSDENPNNAKCFNDSIGRFPHDVQSRLLYKQKNATDMVLTEERLFLNCQVLVVDPPRKGLDADVVEFLCETGWQTLKLVVYVSCGFRAFQRDCNAMLNSGHWKLEFAEGYLLFPGSDAIETLAFFTSELTVSGSR